MNLFEVEFYVRDDAHHRDIRATLLVVGLLGTAQKTDENVKHYSTPLL